MSFPTWSLYFAPKQSLIKIETKRVADGEPHFLKASGKTDLGTAQHSEQEVRSTSRISVDLDGDEWNKMEVQTYLPG
jgi:hypothetical protein